MTPASALVLPSARARVQGIGVNVTVAWEAVHSRQPWTEFLSGLCYLDAADADVLSSVSAPLVATGNYAEFPNVGIAATPGQRVQLLVECNLVNGGPPVTGTATVKIVEWEVELKAPLKTFRMDLTAISVVVIMPDLETIPENRRLSNVSYFSPDMSCTLRTVNSTALALPSNSLNSRISYVPSLNGSAGHGEADFDVRFSAEPGEEVVIVVDCDLSGHTVTSALHTVSIVDFTGQWEDGTVVTTWLPSSGTFLLPLDPPPTVRFQSDGVPLEDASRVACQVSIPVDGSDKGEANLVNSPPFGYPGIGAVVRMDRVVIASEFGATVSLQVQCTREAETLTLPPIILSMPSLAATIVPPFLQPNLVTQQPFQVHLALVPNTELVRSRAEVKCSLLCPEAIAMAGGSATSANGDIIFDSAAITGVIGSSYELRIVCELGVMQLPPIPSLYVHIEACPVGTEPDSSNTR
ncbi:unnamed protein product, partial [Symbiodinium sp. KB8]